METFQLVRRRVPLRGKAGRASLRRLDPADPDIAASPADMMERFRPVPIPGIALRAPNGRVPCAGDPLITAFDAFIAVIPPIWCDGFRTIGTDVIDALWHPRRGAV